MNQATYKTLKYPPFQVVIDRPTSHLYIWLQLLMKSSYQLINCTIFDDKRFSVGKEYDTLTWGDNL